MRGTVDGKKRLEEFMTATGIPGPSQDAQREGGTGYFTPSHTMVTANRRSPKR